MARTVRSTTALVAAGLIFSSTTTFAQEIVLEGITIFGSKVSQTLEDQSASVGIVTSKDIEEKAITSVRDAFRTLGNVSDSDFVDAGFVIRGINSEGLTPGGAPLASFYIDGVQQTVNGTRRGARGLWDVEQVEVYRGPQSTLSGRAALAGAIHVKTKDPTKKFEAAIRGTAGTLGNRDVAVMVNAPVSNDLAIRLSAEYQTAENDINYPTFQNFALFDEFIEDEYYQIRGKALFEPGSMPGFKALLSYSLSHDSPHSDDIGGPGLGFNFSDKRGDFTLPTFVESRSADNHNIGLEVSQDFGSGIILTSLTTYSYNDTERPSVNLGTPGQANVVIGNQEQELATQEVRLNIGQGPLKAVAGIYYARTDNFAGFDRPNFFGFASDESRSTEQSDNIAAFGELTYEFAPSWKVVAGGRADYTSSDVTTSFVRTFFGGGQTVTGFEGSFDEFVFLPKAGLIKEFSETQSVGLTVQRGFRGGGAGIQRSTGNVFTVDPEFAWNYELSYKGRFLDDKLRINANVFFMDWEDQQVEVLADPLDFTSGITVNAASSESLGFEIEAQYQVTSVLSIFASTGYVDTQFKEFNSVELGDVSGLPFPEAPKWNVAFGAQLKSEEGYYIGFDAKYTSDFLARFGQNPQEFVDGFFVANAQMGFDGEHFEAKLFAENLFDENYFTYNDNDIAATLGPRRVVGVRVTGKF